MPNEREITVKDQRFISRLHKYVMGEISKREISLEDVAAYMCITRGQLNRRVKSITGLTAQRYVIRLKLNRACELLTDENEYMISEIAFMTGFGDATSFSRAFKREYGIAPSQYRMEHDVL